MKLTPLRIAGGVVLSATTLAVAACPCEGEPSPQQRTDRQRVAEEEGQHNS
jgi:hypothetical protein